MSEHRFTPKHIGRLADRARRWAVEAFIDRVAHPTAYIAASDIREASDAVARVRDAFERYIAHRDLAAAAAMRASHRTGGTTTWQREIANHDRHLAAAEDAAAIIRSALAKARGDTPPQANSL